MPTQLTLQTLGQFTGRDETRYRLTAPLIYDNTIIATDGRVALIIEDPAPSLMEETRQSLSQWQEAAEASMPPTTGDMLTMANRCHNLGADFTLPDLPAIDLCDTCQGTSFVDADGYPISPDHVPAIPWNLPEGIAWCDDCDHGETRAKIDIGPATFVSDKLRPIAAIMPMPGCRIHYVADSKAHMLTASGVIDGTRILCCLMSLGIR